LKRVLKHSVYMHNCEL